MGTVLAAGDAAQLELDWERPFDTREGEPALEIADLGPDGVAIRFWRPDAPAGEADIIIVPAKVFAEFIAAAHFGGQYNGKLLHWS